MEEIRRILRGWSNYFGYGTRLMAYQAVDHYVSENGPLPAASPQGGFAWQLPLLGTSCVWVVRKMCAKPAEVGGAA